jgi:hypothetical protein
LREQPTERRKAVKTTILVAIVSLVIAAGAADSAAQTAGSTLISTEQLREVATGWSAKKQILGKDVYNDAGEKIGDIIDVCVSNRHTMFSRDTLGTCDHREAPRSWSDGDGAGLSC